MCVDICDMVRFPPMPGSGVCSESIQNVSLEVHFCFVSRDVKKDG